MFKKIVLALIVLCAMSSACARTSSNEYVRFRSVKLKGVEGGSCSGEQVTAPSGRMYILSAGHCKDLRGAKNSITVETEDGKSLERAIVAEDTKSDLLLLEGLPKMQGLMVADKYTLPQHVRTFTHGAGLPTYETEGVLVGRARQLIMLGFIGSTYEGDCRGPKYRIMSLETSYGEMSACVLDVMQMVSTAMVVPGSSGGMVVDDNGQLIGVVSATDGKFSYLVSLQDIQSFVSAY